MANFLKSLFVKGIEIDPDGATSAQVLSYNGTKFVPVTNSATATTDASALTSGILDNARLPAAATNITTVGTLGSLVVTNGVTAATFTGALTGNASTATNVAYTGLTGTVTTWNQNTTGTAATLTSTRTLWGQNFNGSANVSGALTGATTVALSGATSGTTTLQASAVAGTTTITLPAATGTVALTDSVMTSSHFIGTTSVALNRASGALALTGITSIDGNAATVTTNANLTGDVTSSGNITTLTNAPVIAKVLTGYVLGSGTVAATDSILQAFQKKADLASPTFSGTVNSPNFKTSGASRSHVNIGASDNATGNGSSINIRAVDNVASSRAVYLQDSSGTIALTSDVDAVRAAFSSGQATITPVANAATVGAVSWGRTLSAQPRVTTSANSGASTVTNTSFTDVTTTGCNVYILRTNTTSTIVHAIAVVG